ncbi:hypothetical protein C479_09618 [Halovivax asiaticus JCM 14624]|uniref:TM helix repeat-containing protein n=1 Tax=Halovivax asiaticus JCM 14624 TaxID=1227490 RepID=M0BN88_9EURY|nr:hypothetical protein [Halovivax asiaticus]ELZ11059.1 hypothetical protein C479_09618 [Halovivax asiaticus JCM 14624]
MTTEQLMTDDQSFTGALVDAIESGVIAAFDMLPELIVALVILLVGTVVARRVRPTVVRIATRAQAGDLVRRTPLGTLFGDGERAVENALGSIAKYYVFLVAVFAAFEHIGFTHVTQWLGSGIDYVPVFVGGLGLLVIGFVVADNATRRARDSALAAKLGDEAAVADGLKAGLYAVVAVIALDTLGVSVTIVHVVAEAFAFGAGIALALAVAYLIVVRHRDEIESTANDVVADD